MSLNDCISGYLLPVSDLLMPYTFTGQDNQSRQSGRVTFPNSAKSASSQSVMSGGNHRTHYTEFLPKFCACHCVFYPRVQDPKHFRHVHVENTL